MGSINNWHAKVEEGMCGWTLNGFIGSLWYASMVGMNPIGSFGLVELVMTLEPSKNGRCEVLLLPPKTSHQPNIYTHLFTWSPLASKGLVINLTFISTSSHGGWNVYTIQADNDHVCRVVKSLNPHIWWEWNSKILEISSISEDHPNFISQDHPNFIIKLAKPKSIPHNCIIS